MLTKEEIQQIENVLDHKLATIHKKLDMLTQGAITTVTNVDALEDQERQKN